MRKYLALAALALAAAIPAPVYAMTDGNELFTKCNADIHSAEFGVCLGYLQGFMEANSATAMVLGREECAGVKNADYGAIFNTVNRSLAAASTAERSKP